MSGSRCTSSRCIPPLPPSRLKSSAFSGFSAGVTGFFCGSVCVGFVHQCFYEVFDQLGPQLRWWQWNTDNPINHPMFASVPMTSMYIFATLGPAVLTFLVMWFVGRHVPRGKAFGGLSFGWRTVVAGLLVPVGVAILSVPSSLFSGHVRAQAVVFAVEIAVFALIAIPILAAAVAGRVKPPRPTSSSPSSAPSTLACSRPCGSAHRPARGPREA